ncbi:MAG: hypothetical protein H0W77_05650 [Acidobacteria bacterium]|nr:hypothetical protein [Acidobacteriota bacterium]
MLPYILALIDLAILTAGMFAVGNHINPITVALIFLLFVSRHCFRKQTCTFRFRDSDAMF